ncbi:hypothetical protein DPMN_030013 [Dreissena polymorpha]|uniref:Uncharacterized protein n=1 Tax=Dreissena polymorpha TaxID=45954 RepID=A0A9D4LZ65_DREPO|nr:hypothetical protein DPMN_030013 [Dreissena polymorpha]
MTLKGAAWRYNKRAWRSATLKRPEKNTTYLIVTMRVQLMTMGTDNNNATIGAEAAPAKEQGPTQEAESAEPTEETQPESAAVEDDRQVVGEVEEAPAETPAEEGEPIAEGEEPPDEAGNENNNATEEGDAEGRASKGDGAAAEGDAGDGAPEGDDGDGKAEEEEEREDEEEEDDEEEQPEFDREELIERYHQAIVQREQYQQKNYQLQHKLAEFFRKKKADDSRQDYDKNVTDQEQRYLKYMGILSKA